MIRHYCVSCSRKLNADKMKHLWLPYVHRKIWVCLVCFSGRDGMVREVKDE